MLIFEGGAIQELSYNKLDMRSSEAGGNTMSYNTHSNKGSFHPGSLPQSNLSGQRRDQKSKTSPRFSEMEQEMETEGIKLRLQSDTSKTTSHVPFKEMPSRGGGADSVNLILRTPSSHASPATLRASDQGMT